MSIHSITKAVAIVNTWKQDARAIADEIVAHLSAKHVVCDIYEYDGLSPVKPIEPYDFAISLGGDGTVLYAARCCARRHIPIFPVNLGEFGFIAGVERHAWKQPLDDFLCGKLNSTERMLLSIRVERGNTTVFSSDALNDAVITGSGMAKIVCLEILFNTHSFGIYKADGVIVATPTGSTAYSAAAGGPIVAPDMSAFVLSPVCAFSLSNRPIVLSSSGTMRIRVLPMRHKDIMLTVDGQEVFPLEENDNVFIDESPCRVRLIGCDMDVFYHALTSKLNWSGNPVRGGAHA